MTSPSTLPQPSHEGDEGQSAGRKTSRPPGPKKAPSRVSDAEQQIVARYVDRDTACDDAQPGRTAEPRVMFEQLGGLFCDIIMNEITFYLFHFAYIRNTANSYDQTFFGANSVLWKQTTGWQFIPNHTNSFCHFNDTVYVLQAAHSDVLAFQLQFKI